MAPLRRRSWAPRGHTPRLRQRGRSRRKVSVIGALVMASLSYGLSFMGMSSPIQDIVAGIVLIVAVGFDTYNRRRAS